MPLQSLNKCQMICLTLESTNAHFLVTQCKEVNVIIIIYHVMHCNDFSGRVWYKAIIIKSHSLYNTIYLLWRNSIYNFKYLNSYKHYNYKWSCLYWGYNQIWFYDILRFRYVCKKGYNMEVKTLLSTTKTMLSTILSHIRCQP